jgi:hypothetical protein
MWRLLVALSILIIVPICSTSALEAPSKRQAEYTILSIVCAIGPTRVALDVVLEERLNREGALPAIESGLIRAGFDEASCGEIQSIESDKPLLDQVAYDAALPRVTLVVSSGGIPEAGDRDVALFQIYFDEEPAVISIEDDGRWTARQTGVDCRKTRCRHGPTSNFYYNPRRLLDCPGGIESNSIASDHLVQIFRMRCVDATQRHDLVYFGLSRFGYSMQDGTAQSIGIQGSAFLALEFEVKRNITALVLTP